MADAMEGAEMKGGEQVEQKEVERKGDPGAHERHSYGRLYLEHGSHEHKFADWALGAWKLCPENEYLRSFIKSLYADLDASVKRHQSPEVRHTGRINFLATNITQACSEAALGEASKHLEAYAAFEEVFDEANVVNTDAFEPSEGKDVYELLEYVLDVTYVTP